MLRRLIQGIEQTLGPTLSEVSFVIYWGGILLLALAVVVPFYRRLMEYAARRVGLTQHWVTTCRLCGKLGVIRGPYCGYCDETLEIPVLLSLWTGATRKPAGAQAERWMWWVHCLGSTLFLLLSLRVATSIDAFTAEGHLHRLFVGLALLAWAGLGRFAGRTLRLDQAGIMTRVRNGMMALAAIGLMALSAVLASQAGPVPESVLARFSTDGLSARIQDQRLALDRGQLGFEYLQLDHELFGYHGVIAVAFHGRERLPVSGWPLRGPVVNHLRHHAEAYTARGLVVRLRTDHVIVIPGHSYQVVQRRGQVHIRRVDGIGSP